MTVKLGKRLRQIESMITDEYDHVWDCCCDHGLLGQALLGKKQLKQVHFVDIVPKLMKKLEGTLETSYKELSSRWTMHCCDVVNIPLSNHPGKHLIILAGIGGDLTKEIVMYFCKHYPDIPIDYILCPVYHQFELRKELLHLQLGFKFECLVRENKRYYELLMVSSKNQSREEYDEISSVGENIWQYTNKEQQSIAEGYLEKILSHYAKRTQYEPDLYRETFEAYQNIVIRKR